MGRKRDPDRGLSDPILSYPILTYPTSDTRVSRLGLCKLMSIGFFIFKLGGAWAGPSEAGYITTFIFQRKIILITHKKIQSNNLQQTTTYSLQKKKRRKHNIRESRMTTWRRMKERLEDGSRRQLGFALRRSSNTNTEVLKSFRWPHTRVVTTTSYIQTSTTFSRHQSQLPLTILRVLTRFITDFQRARTCSLHFTLTDWRPLRVAASSHAPCQSRGHVVHESPRHRHTLYVVKRLHTNRRHFLYMCVCSCVIVI